MKNEIKNVNMKTLPDLPRELRSHIYQQIQDLSPFFLPDSEVFVQVDQKLNESFFSVNLKLTGAGAALEVSAESEDVYKAVVEAKEALLSHLYALQSEFLQQQESSSASHQESYRGYYH